MIFRQVSSDFSRRRFVNRYAASRPFASGWWSSGDHRYGQPQGLLFLGHQRVVGRAEYPEPGVQLLQQTTACQPMIRR